MPYRFCKYLISAALLLLFLGCSNEASNEIQPVTLQDDVEWLSDEERKGRLAGSPQEAEAANYISDRFRKYGLEPAGDGNSYVQLFTLRGPMAQAMNSDNLLSRNIVGKIEGEELSNQTIIIGAHYDGQGMGGIVSMEEDVEPRIHPGADDNASGTAALLQLVKHYSENQPRKNILFAAFSGEELGLLGSQYFVDQMEPDNDNIMAMINLDMIGRMTDHKLSIFGTGTSSSWNDILDEISIDSLDVSRVPTGSGASDHASFYSAGIPVLHYHTGAHEDYHRSTDTAEKINYKGIEKVISHVIDVIDKLGGMDAADIDFMESTDPHGATFDFDGPTLGVLPDYSFSGTGFKIEEVRKGEPAELAGIVAGDIIIKMGEIEITDIYDYMNALDEIQQGDELPVTVERDGQEVELIIRF